MSCQQGLDETFKDPQAYIHYLEGISFLYLDNERAYIELLFATEIIPDNPRFVVPLASILLNQDKLNESLQVLIRLKQNMIMDTFNGFARSVEFILAQIYYLKEMYPEAVQHGLAAEKLLHQEVLTIERATFYSFLGGFIWSNGQKERAREYLKKSIITMPKFPLAMQLMESANQVLNSRRRILLLNGR